MVLRRGVVNAQLVGFVAIWYLRRIPRQPYPARGSTDKLVQTERLSGTAEHGLVISESRVAAVIERGSNVITGGRTDESSTSSSVRSAGRHHN